MKKSKFGGINFGSAAVLLKDEQKKVNGGGFGYGSGNNFICFRNLPPYKCFSDAGACAAQCPDGNGGFGYPCSRVTNCQ